MQNPVATFRCFCVVASFSALLFGASFAGAAEPYRPAQDNVVLERLPWRVDGDARRLADLRKALADRPDDVVAALALARHAFRLAIAHGDSRWAGMGEAALKPWWDKADAAVDVLLVRALLKQYRHEFDAALADLALAAQAAPTRADIRSWRVAIHLVHADIDAARADCESLAPGNNGQDLRECRAWIAGVSGNARGAYAEFLRIAAETTGESAGSRRWILLQLAENAMRLGRRGDAETHLRAAHAISGPDHAILIALADFLFEDGRYREVEDLLGPQYQSDAALLRRALARNKLGDVRWRADADRLNDRYNAARQRGEALRESDEARLHLELYDQPAVALRLAQSNWRIQRESADARILLLSAIAAKKPQEAAPVLEWLERTRIEEPRLIELARSLRRPG